MAAVRPLLAEFLEGMVRDAFAGRAPLLGAALDHAAELMQIYGLEPKAIGDTPEETP
jgi:hypothetical protein